MYAHDVLFCENMRELRWSRARTDTRENKKLGPQKRRKSRKRVDNRAKMTQLHEHRQLTLGAATVMELLLLVLFQSPPI